MIPKSEQSLQFGYFIMKKFREKIASISMFYKSEFYQFLMFCKFITGENITFKALNTVGKPNLIDL